MKKPLELYLHIPFCVKKCNYCDFLSAPSTEGERQEYVESLCARIRSNRARAEAYRVVSVFAGGGTPSILTPDQMQRIFAALRETFEIAADAEITVEANPGTVDKEKLDVYRSLGINRLSIGLQSADDAELRILGRIHTHRDFLDTYQAARRAGFENINVDLITAVPGQTMESWVHTLEKTAQLGPEHISAYSLILEEGTSFYEIYGPDGSRAAGNPQIPQLPDEDTEREMYCVTRKILARYGYHRYEISNYAREGYECRHNLGYWERTEYLGIGAGAASFLDHMRWNEGERPEKLSREDEMAEYMFLGLRKTAGVSIRGFEAAFGETLEARYGDVIRKMTAEGLLETEGDFLRLSERGLDVSNYVMCEFV